MSENEVDSIAFTDAQVARWLSLNRTSQVVDQLLAQAVSEVEFLSVEKSRLGQDRAALCEETGVKSGGVWVLDPKTKICTRKG